MTQKVHIVRDSSGKNPLWALLTLMFVGLKLAGEIQWSWWEVFIPVFIGLPLGIVAAMHAELKGSK